MPEHSVGFPPARGTRVIMPTVVKGPSHQNLSLLNFKCAARIITPRGTPLHKKAGVRAGNLENEPYKIIKWYLSLLCLGVATIDDYP